MGPLRGDGNSELRFLLGIHAESREDGSPSWGRKPTYFFQLRKLFYGREDGSPSWGRKPKLKDYKKEMKEVEKMGPLRGDGNLLLGCPKT